MIKTLHGVHKASPDTSRELSKATYTIENNDGTLTHNGKPLPDGLLHSSDSVSFLIVSIDSLNTWEGGPYKRTVAISPEAIPIGIIAFGSEKLTLRRFEEEAHDFINLTERVRQQVVAEQTEPQKEEVEEALPKEA